MTNYDAFIREVSEISSLIMDIPRFDGKKWDWGQWVCVLLYGENWSENFEFNRIDSTREVPTSMWPRLKRLREWLEAERELVRSNKK